MRSFKKTLTQTLFLKKKKMVVYRNKSSYKKFCITLKKKRQWCAREKLLIVHYAEQCGSNRLAAKKFEVEPKQI